MSNNWSRDLTPELREFLGYLLLDPTPDLGEVLGGVSMDLTPDLGRYPADLLLVERV